MNFETTVVIQLGLIFGALLVIARDLYAIARSLRRIEHQQWSQGLDKKN